MIKVILLSLLLSMTGFALDEEPVMMSGDYEISARTKHMASRYENDLRGGGMRYKTDRALDAIIKLAVYKLRRVGKTKEATQILKEWQSQWEYSLLYTRGLGAHAPLSQWLSDKYLQLEFLLGKQVMMSLRLVDLYKINHALPVVISCIDNVSEEEYFAHFVDDVEYGWTLGPIVLYWTSFFTCTGLSWGTGFLFCSPIAMGAEYLSGQFICPKLNPILWKIACHH